MLHLADPKLGKAVGTEQAGMGGDRMIFARLGVADLIKQHRSDQHGVDLVLAAQAEDHRPHFLEPTESMVAQGLQLVDAVAEQLGQPRLGSVHSETPLQFLQFLSAEGQGVCPGVLGIDHRRFADPGAGCGSAERHQATEGQRASSQPQHSSTVLPVGSDPEPLMAWLRVVAEQPPGFGHCDGGDHGTRLLIGSCKEQEGLAVITGEESAGFARTRASKT